MLVNEIVLIGQKILDLYSPGGDKQDLQTSDNKVNQVCCKENNELPKWNFHVSCEGGEEAEIVQNISLQ